MSDLLGIGLNVAGNAMQNQARREASRETAELNYLMNLDMWERQNEYNHPTAQMERLKSAGLNPHLVYGSGAAQSPASLASAPRAQTPEVTNTFEGLNMSLIGAQTEYMKAMAEKERTEADQIKADMGLGYDEYKKGKMNWKTFLSNLGTSGNWGKRLESQTRQAVASSMLKNQEFRAFQIAGDAFKKMISERFKNTAEWYKIRNALMDREFQIKAYHQWRAENKMNPYPNDAIDSFLPFLIQNLDDATGVNIMDAPGQFRNLFLK